MHQTLPKSSWLDDRIRKPLNLRALNPKPLRHDGEVEKTPDSFTKEVRIRRARDPKFQARLSGFIGLQDVIGLQGLIIAFRVLGHVGFRI